MATIDTNFIEGKKVKVKKYKKLPDYWVPAMKKFMGEHVTIKAIVYNKKASSRYIKINEDQNDIKGGWRWSPFNFEEV